MPDRGAVISKAWKSEPMVYCYDGSFDGLLCCVFESYGNHETPADILPEDCPLPLLLPVKTVATDAERAKRVLRSIPVKMGRKALEFIRHSFLTCHPKKERLILQFMRLGYIHGSAVMDRLADESVHELFVAVNHLTHEAHLYQGFVRFSEAQGVLTAQIEPKNIVLPLIARHFSERYPGERFLIYDKTHRMVLLHEDRSIQICGVDAYEPPNPGEEELKFRMLWRLFYDTIEIKERHNPHCRMSHMPKRFWRCMTEFARDTQTASLCLPDSLPGANTAVKKY